MSQAQQTADEDLGSLREQMKTTTARATTAEQRATTAETENEKLRRQASEAIAQRTRADKTAAAAAIAAGEQEAANLTTQLNTAMHAGDAPAVARITRQLATTQTRIDGWNNQKQRIETWEKQQLAQFEAQQRRQQQASQQPQYSTQSQQWLDSHPEIKNDPARMQEVVRAHYHALGEGIIPDTPDYFRHIEGRMKLGGAASGTSTHQEDDPQDDATSGAATVTLASTADQRDPAAAGGAGEEEPPERLQRQSRQAAAPPSRTVPQQRAQRPGAVKLTREEVEIAKNSFSWLKTDEERITEYAKNKAALQAEGRLNG